MSFISRRPYMLIPSRSNTSFIYNPVTINSFRSNSVKVLTQEQNIIYRSMCTEATSATSTSSPPTATSSSTTPTTTSTATTTPTATETAKPVQEPVQEPVKEIKKKEPRSVFKTLIFTSIAAGAGYSAYMLGTKGKKIFFFCNF